MNFEEYKEAMTKTDFYAEYNFNTTRRRDLARAYYHYLLLKGLSKLWALCLKQMFKQHKFFEIENAVTELRKKLDEEN